MTTDLVDVGPAAIAIILVAIAFLTFSYNKLFGTILGLMHLGIPSQGDVLLIVIIVTVVALPLAFLKIWTRELFTAASYTAWLLFLPTALYYSGIDVFRILSISANFSVFSSSLSYTTVAIAGVLLACGTLANRLFARLKDAGKAFMSRGADPREVSVALFRNARFGIKLIAITGAATVIFALVAPSAGQYIQTVFKAGGITYLLAGLGSIVLLALVLVLFLWPHKNGEKG